MATNTTLVSPDQKNTKYGHSSRYVQDSENCLKTEPMGSSSGLPVVAAEDDEVF